MDLLKDLYSWASLQPMLAKLGMMILLAAAGLYVICVMSDCKEKLDIFMESLVDNNVGNVASCSEFYWRGRFKIRFAGGIIRFAGDGIYTFDKHRVFRKAVKIARSLSRYHLESHYHNQKEPACC